MMHKVFAFAVLAAITYVVSGCATYRLVPSHGGGKRFDEEQRVVATSIRNTIAQMDLKELAGKRVNLAIVSLAANGGSSVTMPGLSSISAGYHNSTNKYPNYPIHSDSSGGSVNASFTPNVSGYPTVFGTDQDLTYLESCLHMKLRLGGTAVTVPDPNYILYVLVDVLGTNRSKVDSIIFSRDVLIASCEVTYYLFDFKANQVIGVPKRASAQSAYIESGWVGFTAAKVERYMCDTKPMPMPTDVNDAAIATNGRILVKGITPRNLIPVEIKHNSVLDEKIANAESYIQAGNITAAERILNEVRTANPDYPGLDALSSRVTNLKSARSDKTATEASQKESQK